MTPADTAVMAFWFLIAAGVATLIRLKDYPPVELEMKNLKLIGETYIGALAGAVIGAKLLENTVQLLNNGAVTAEGLLVIVTLAMGGMASVRAVIAQYQTMQAKPPA